MEQKFIAWYLDNWASRVELKYWESVKAELLSAFHNYNEDGKLFADKAVRAFFNSYNKENKNV